MSEYIHIFIKNKADEIPTDERSDIEKFLPFYDTIPDNNLACLFAYMHSKFNSLFAFMNKKSDIKGRHYNADQSRALIGLIGFYRKLDDKLSNTQFAFKIDDDYLNIIRYVQPFLSVYNGSPIPEDFQKISIIDIKPVFELREPRNISISETKKEGLHVDKKKVFIVHGHDNEAKYEVARFIEGLKLEVIILHEQASQSMTIIEKIERFTSEASFAVVLYTPCDKGRGAKETKSPSRYRARQNVVFEHGYLMAKLGRENVCALVKGNVETPSDISGIVYTPLDQNGGWESKLKRELRACGYNI